jgi:NADPH:quinone reductase-like Zn-dependent oxidoreductase
MRAVVIEEHGGRDALRIAERPDPEPGPGQVRVRVRAVALNHLDIWVRKGIPGVQYPLPLIPGCDGAGLVDALGPGVTGLEPGSECVLAPGVSCGRCEACSRGDDNLCRYYGILGENRDGTCADFIVVPGQNVLAKPGNLSFEEAAALPLPFLTAWHMLMARARLRPGETVLIHAAGSGVSTAAIQMADMVGARILVTAGSDEKLEKAKELGAEVGINYRTHDFAEEVRRLTGKRGVDVVLDHVGEDTWEGNIKSLAKGGRLVFCGNTSGVQAMTSLPHVFFKSLSLLGSTMGSRSEVHEILRLAEKEVLQPVVDRVLPLERVEEGHRVLEDREAFGRVVLTPW